MAKRKRKRRKTDTDSDAARVERKGPFSPELAQKIGYAVQVIVRGWNAYAASKGFDDCEDMLGRFLVFDKNKLKFRVPTKKEGEAPYKSSRSFRGNCEPTTDRTRTYKLSDKRPSNFVGCRTLAQIFLHDIETFPLADQTFSVSEYSGEWEVEEEFFFDQGKYPKRFDTLKDPKKDSLSPRAAAAADQRLNLYGKRPLESHGRSPTTCVRSPTIRGRSPTTRGRSPSIQGRSSSWRPSSGASGTSEMDVEDVEKYMDLEEGEEHMDLEGEKDPEVESSGKDGEEGHQEQGLDEIQPAVEKPDNIRSRVGSPENNTCVGKDCRCTSA